MRLGLVTVVIACLILLTIVGRILRLVLDDIGGGNTCPHCSALLVVPLRITGEER